MKGGNILELEKVVLTLDGKRIINGMSLEIQKKEIHCVIGVNGTGKTTLAYLLMGIYKPDAGRTFFEEKDITDFDISRREV